MLSSEAVDAATRTALDRLWAAAFDDFGPTDAAHAYGGLHVLVRDGAEVLAHASVVPRTLRIGGVPRTAGYVEGVAVAPERQGRGLGAVVMTALHEQLPGRFEVAMLSTGEHGFYARLGWERWRGPSYVARDGAAVRTPEDDDSLMVLLLPGSPALDLAAPVMCHDRPGDPW